MKHKYYLLIKDSKRPWDCSAGPVVENVFNKIISIKGIFVLKLIIESVYLSETELYIYVHNNQLWV
jgi:hypothetical protein